MPEAIAPAAIEAFIAARPTMAAALIARGRDQEAKRLGYEQGLVIGLERGRADERQRIRQAADTRFAGWYVIRADLLDGAR